MLSETSTWKVQKNTDSKKKRSY